MFDNSNVLLNWQYNHFGETKQTSEGEFHMRRMFGFLIGVLVGALVGSMVALLLAPESGENLRGQIRERGKGFMNEVRHAADSRRIELRGRLETLRAPRAE